MSIHATPDMPSEEDARARAHITRCLDELAQRARRDDDQRAIVKLTALRTEWDTRGRLDQPHAARLIHAWAARQATGAGSAARAEAAATRAWMAEQGYEVPTS